jgi:xanthine dehydrogenase accessory factor
MSSWIADLAGLVNNGKSSVLVTVASVRGSAPREVGAKMIVTVSETIGTIGGGQLEHQCSKFASEQLSSGVVLVGGGHMRRFALGANCGQCCGGVVEIMFEPLCGSNATWLGALKESHDERAAVVMATSTKESGTKFLISGKTCKTFSESSQCPADVLLAARSLLTGDDPADEVGDFLLEPIRPVTFNIAVFGAGHVGAATIDVLSRLDCNIRWIDSRRNIFPASLPANVLALESTDPGREVMAMPAGSWFLVMTHSHPLDHEICAQVLQREDFAYCGLIGSFAKRRRFERLMKKQGVADRLLERLVCPIGVTGVGGRKPAEIAIAVAAEVLQVRHAMLTNTSGRHGKDDIIRAL